MSDPSRHRPAAGSQWSRRSVLGLAMTAGGLGWAGCTLSDPTISGPGRTTTTTRGTPSPAPRPTDPAAAQDAARELVLATSAATLVGGARLPQARRSLLALVRRTHLERAAALTSPDPSGRPAGAAPAAPGPSPTSSGKPSLGRLADAERRVADRYRTVALRSAGLDALLWGSMSVASTRFAAALDAGTPPPVAPLRPHRPVTVVSDTEAVAALVSALHAAVYGYQLALGRLKVLGRDHARAAAGLRGHRALLDQLADRLITAGVAVPPAAPAYDPAPEVRDAATARQLLRRVESALLPFCGLWLAAAAHPADRRQAFDTFAGTAATAAAWGAPLIPWPGWQD